MKPKTLMPVIMTVLCLWVVAPIRADRLVSEDGQVKIFSRDPILPHGYGDMILEFKGKRYRHLISPGYAVTPAKGGIIFVTEK